MADLRAPLSSCQAWGGGQRTPSRLVDVQFFVLALATFRRCFACVSGTVRSRNLSCCLNTARRAVSKLVRRRNYLEENGVSLSSAFGSAALALACVCMSVACSWLFVRRAVVRAIMPAHLLSSSSFALQFHWCIQSSPLPFLSPITSTTTTTSNDKKWTTLNPQRLNLHSYPPKCLLPWRISPI